MLVKSWHMPMYQGQSMTDNPPPTDADDLDDVSVFDKETFLMVGGDGACEHQAEPRIRRAVSGHCYGVGHPANISAFLGGDCLPAQRTQLQACARVFALAWRPTAYPTDFMVVVDLFNRLMDNMAISNLKNPDVLDRIAKAFLAKGAR